MGLSPSEQHGTRQAHTTPHDTPPHDPFSSHTMTRPDPPHGPFRSAPGVNPSDPHHGPFISHHTHHCTPPSQCPPQSQAGPPHAGLPPQSHNPALSYRCQLYRQLYCCLYWRRALYCCRRPTGFGAREGEGQQRGCSRPGTPRCGGGRGWSSPV